MSLSMMSTQALVARAVRQLAEIYEWYGEIEEVNYQPPEADLIREEIDWTAECLGPVIVELAKRGKLQGRLGENFQLGLELPGSSPERDPFPGIATSDLGASLGLQASEDLPF